MTSNPKNDPAQLHNWDTAQQKKFVAAVERFVDLVNLLSGVATKMQDFASEVKKADYCWRADRGMSACAPHGTDAQGNPIIEVTEHDQGGEFELVQPKGNEPGQLGGAGPFQTPQGEIYEGAIEILPENENESQGESGKETYPQTEKEKGKKGRKKA